MSGTPLAVDEADGTDEADASSESTPLPAPVEAVSPQRFVAAFFIACVLFLAMAILFAGLGPLGLAPAIVVATTLAGRATRIRRRRVLAVVGILTFAVMVLVPYAILIAAYTSKPAAGG